MNSPSLEALKSRGEALVGDVVKYVQTFDAHKALAEARTRIATIRWADLAHTLKTTDRATVQVYTALLVLASLMVFLGSHGSVSIPLAIKKRLKAAGKAEEEDEDEEELERLSDGDAAWLPVIGSLALGGLYLALKYLDKDVINLIVNVYLSAVSLFSLASFFGDAGMLALRCAGKRSLVNGYTLQLNRNRKLSAKTGRFTEVHVLAAALSLAFTILRYTCIPKDKEWIATNIMGLGFSYSGLKLMRLDSFTTGIIALLGLFLYDIWWVFGTPVMESVAKGIDAPIKILWPYSLWDTDPKFGLLGLGDIIVPGIFVALALRYDYRKATSKPGVPPRPYQGFPKPYFCATMFGYVLGLVATMASLRLSGRGQPALLFLSPACILTALVTAVVKRDWRSFWAFKDEDTEAIKAAQDKAKKEEERAHAKKDVKAKVDTAAKQVSDTAEHAKTEAGKLVNQVASPRFVGSKPKKGRK